MAEPYQPFRGDAKEHKPVTRALSSSSAAGAPPADEDAWRSPRKDERLKSPPASHSGPARRHSGPPRRRQRHVTFNESLNQERRFFKHTPVNEFETGPFSYPRPLSFPTVQRAPDVSQFHALFAAVRNQSLNDVVALLEQGGATEPDTLQRLPEIREHLKDDGDSDPEAPLKHRLLKIWINADTVARTARSLKSFVRFEINVEHLEGFWLARSARIKGGENVLAATVKASHDKSFSHRLHREPMSRSIAFKSSPFGMNHNTSTATDRSISVYLRNEIKDGPNFLDIGCFTFFLSDLHRTCSKDGRWCEIKQAATENQTNKLLRGGTLTIRARRCEVPRGYLEKQKKQARRKLAEVIGWIKRLNQDILENSDKDDDRPVFQLSANVRVHGNLTLLHSAIALEDAELVKKLIAVGADPHVKSVVGSPVSLALNMADRVVEKTVDGDDAAADKPSARNATCNDKQRKEQRSRTNEISKLLREYVRTVQHPESLEDTGADDVFADYDDATPEKKSSVDVQTQDGARNANEDAASPTAAKENDTSLSSFAVNGGQDSSAGMKQSENGIGDDNDAGAQSHSTSPHGFVRSGNQNTSVVNSPSNQKRHARTIHLQIEEDSKFNLTGFLIGRQGENRKRLEAETGCGIRISEVSGSMLVFVDISGDSIDGVNAAADMMEQVVFRRKQQMREQSRYQSFKEIQSSLEASTSSEKPKGAVDAEGSPTHEEKVHSNQQKVESTDDRNKNLEQDTAHTDSEPCIQSDKSTERKEVHERTIRFCVDVRQERIFKGLLVGHRGETHKRLEAQTGCKISIRDIELPREGPDAQQLSGNRAECDSERLLPVVVTGGDQKTVDEASNMIEHVLLYRKRQPQGGPLQDFFRLYDEMRCTSSQNGQPGSQEQTPSTSDHVGAVADEGRDSEQSDNQEKLVLPEVEEPNWLLSVRRGGRYWMPCRFWEQSRRCPYRRCYFIHVNKPGSIILDGEGGRRPESLHGGTRTSWPDCWRESSVHRMSRHSEDGRLWYTVGYFHEEGQKEFFYPQGRPGHRSEQGLYWYETEESAVEALKNVLATVERAKMARKPYARVSAETPTKPGPANGQRPKQTEPDRCSPDRSNASSTGKPGKDRSSISGGKSRNRGRKRCSSPEQEELSRDLSPTSEDRTATCGDSGPRTPSRSDRISASSLRAHVDQERRPSLQTSRWEPPLQADQERRPSLQASRWEPPLGTAEQQQPMSGRDVNSVDKDDKVDTRSRKTDATSKDDDKQPDHEVEKSSSSQKRAPRHLGLVIKPSPKSLDVAASKPHNSNNKKRAHRRGGGGPNNNKKRGGGPKNKKQRAEQVAHNTTPNKDSRWGPPISKKQKIELKSDKQDQTLL